jgi:hypothetical protein
MLPPSSPGVASAARARRSMHASASTPLPLHRPLLGGHFESAASLLLGSCLGPLPFPVSTRVVASPWFPNDSTARAEGTNTLLSFLPVGMPRALRV